MMVWSLSFEDTREDKTMSTEKWFGFDKKEFEFEGRRAIIVFPKEAEEEGNWTLKTEYWSAFPETETALLKLGFHAAYLENKSRFATKEDCDAKHRFVEYISREYGLKPKCVPIGMSCGGAHAMNFAGAYPDDVECMFLDAPVLNFLSFPGRPGNAEYEYIWKNEFVKAYPGITRAKLFDFKNHPMNAIDTVIGHKIPIIMLYGTEDKTVLYEENGKILEDAFENAGTSELLEVIPRNLQGHHPHGLLDKSEPITDFIIKHTR